MPVPSLAPFRVTFPRARRARLLTQAACAALIGLAAMTTLPPPARAHGVQAGDLSIRHPWAPPSLPGARSAAVYFRGIVNTGGHPDRLLGARTPAAETVEIHRMTLDGEVMRMRAVDALDLAPGQPPQVDRGGTHHLMLLGLKAPLAAGDRFPVTLRFERAGEQVVEVWVEAPRPASAASAAGHAGHHGH